MTTKAKKPRNPAAAKEPVNRYVATTVRVGDANAHGRHTDSQAVMARAAGGYAMTCMVINARQCSSHQMRLYRKVGKRSTRRLRDRKAIAWLRGDTEHRIGRKTAYYAERAGEVEEVREHEVLDIITHPNQWQRASAFSMLAFAHWELTGRRFVYFDEESDRPALYLMNPQNVRIVPGNDFIDGYWYGRDGVIEQAFATDEVFYHRCTPDPFDPFGALSPMRACLLEADILDQSQQAEFYGWQNGARPDYVISTKDPIGDAQVKQLKAEVESGFKGVRNRGKFLIATSTSVTPLAFTPKEMEYLAGKQDLRKMIRFAFGIPESFESLNDANLASSLTGHRQYNAMTVLPRVNADAEEWTETLLPKFGIEPGDMWFAYDNPVAEDAEALRSDIAVFVPSGVWSIDEARAELGYEPLSEAETLPMPSPITPTAPAGAVPATAEADVQGTALNGAQVTALAELASQVAQGLLPLASARAIAVAAFPAVTAATIDAIFGPLASFTPETTEPNPEPPTVPAPVKSRKRWDRKKNGLGGSVFTKNRADIDKGMDAMQRAVAAWFRKLGGAVSIDPEKGTANLTAAQATELEKVLAPFVERFYQSGIVAGLDGLGSGLDPSSFADRATEFLRGYTVRLAREIAAETEAVLNTQLQEGIAAGENVDQLATRVGTSLDDQSGYRAERIARTETATAFVEGNRTGWREEGVTHVRWMLAPKACPQCEAFAAKFNQPREIDAPFLKVGDSFSTADGTVVPITHRDITGPPLHPACRCDLEPVFSDEVNQ